MVLVKLQGNVIEIIICSTNFINLSFASRIYGDKGR